MSLYVCLTLFLILHDVMFAIVHVVAAWHISLKLNMIDLKKGWLILTQKLAKKLSPQDTIFATNITTTTTTTYPIS